MKQQLTIKALKQVSENGRIVNITITKLDMFPTYIPGDVVKAAPVDIDRITIGDLAFIKINNEIVFHRITKIDHKNMYFLSKGDGLYQHDTPFSQEDLLAIGITHSRNNRDLIFRNNKFMKKLIVFLSPISGFPAFIIAELWKVFQK